ncbi:cellulose binding domain-containing protein [Actinomycetes bacterium KLBMP 9797]
MSEIRLDVELEHSPERVWRALTDERLLPQWLDLPGFDPVSQVELTGRDEPRRLAMLWGNQELHTRLTWELSATDDGCQLLLRQTCVYGEWDDEFRDELRAAYGPVLNERLPAVLDWLAFGEVDLTAPELRDTADEAPTAILTPVILPPPRRGRRRGSLLVVAVGVALVVAGAGLIFLIRPDGAGDAVAGTPTSGGGTTSSASASAVPAAPEPGRADRAARSSSPSVSPTRSQPGPPENATTTPAAAAPDLNARYATVQTRLFGYRGEITLANAGRATAQNWTVTVTLTDGARVTSASGASYTQNDTTVTFTGSAVRAGQSAAFQFEVTGDTRIEDRGVTSCQVDGTPCTT